MSAQANTNLLQFWKSKPAAATPEAERSVLSGWRLLFAWATLMTPFAYFSVDLVHIPEEHHLITGIFRGMLTILCGTALLIGYIQPALVARSWRWGIRLLSTTYCLFMIWLESIAIDPTVSRYYIGMLQIAGAFMVMRITIEHSIILTAMTILYVLVNYDSPIISDAIFDLITFGSIFYLIIRNYKRIENSLEQSQNVKTDIIATITAGWCRFARLLVWREFSKAS